MAETYTLKNGIPVFVAENPASPAVSLHVWVGRGSIHEPAPLAGVSHFLEHSLFKGTAKRQVGEIAQEIEANGGEINAYTSFEETVYYATIAARYRSVVFEILADAVKNPAFDAEEMEREKEVILEEIRRTQDAPFKLAAANLWGTAFANSPFGRPVIGFEKTVRKIDHKSLRKYFTKEYHAGTIALIVSGGVDAKQVVPELNKLFGRIPRRTAAPTRPRIAPMRSSAVVSIARDLKECHVLIGFPTPGIRAPQIPAVDLVCSALGTGESSRLYQYLVKEKKVALDVHFGLSATQYCGLATVSLLVAPDLVETSIRETLQCLERAAAEGFEHGELERVKSSLESEIYAGKETAEGTARRLSFYWSHFGDPNYENEYLSHLRNTEEEACREALAGLLKRPKVLSLAHPNEYRPDKAKLKALLTPSKAKPTRTETAPGAVTQTALDGVVYVQRRLTQLPMLSTRVVFPGGAAYETARDRGLTLLFQRTWASGTAAFKSVDFQRKLDELGASVSPFAGRHTVGVSVNCLTKHWGVVRGLLEEVLLKPQFPAAEVQIEKELMQREILSERDSPGYVCQLNFSQALFGDHPYGRSLLGTKETVDSFTSDHLKDYYRRAMRRGQAVVATVGDDTGFHVANDWKRMLQELPATGQSLPTLPTLPTNGPLAKSRVVSEVRNPLYQTHLLVGFRGIDNKDPRRFALKALSSCLAGQGGRLFLQLRDRESLAYQVSPVSSENPLGGYFGIYIGCAPDKVFQAIAGIRGQLEAVRQSKLAKAEMERAKRFWVGRFELDLQRLSTQSILFALDEFYGLGYDSSLKMAEAMRSITADDVLAFAQEILHPDRAVFSLVHPEPISEEKVLETWSRSA